MRTQESLWEARNSTKSAPCLAMKQPQGVLTGTFRPALARRRKVFGGIGHPVSEPVVVSQAAWHPFSGVVAQHGVGGEMRKSASVVSTAARFSLFSRHTSLEKAEIRSSVASGKSFIRTMQGQTTLESCRRLVKNLKCWVYRRDLLFSEACLPVGS